jgi:hypothetical protein
MSDTQISPNPGMWCTWKYAEDLLGVTRQTVVRMVADEILTQYRNLGGAPMFWLAEVEEIAAARRRVGRGRGEDDSCSLSA